nr:thiamine phosphate synthase [Paracoccus suum]
MGASAAALGPLLAEVLDRVQVACLRLRAHDDLAELGRLADMAREIAHARDVPVVIENHWELALSHGLDGVHLMSGGRKVRDARQALGPDAIVGAFCGNQRHAGINAAEAGADYVTFGPVGGAPTAGVEQAPLDLFAWWSEMIEVPVVAEGHLDAALIAKLAPVTDFIALGAEIWAEPDPAAALSALWR